MLDLLLLLFSIYCGSYYYCNHQPCFEFVSVSLFRLLKCPPNEDGFIFHSYVEIFVIYLYDQYFIFYFSERYINPLDSKYSIKLYS